MTDPNGAAIYGVPWIPSIYPSHVSIYTCTMDPSWDMMYDFAGCSWCQLGKKVRCMGKNS